MRRARQTGALITQRLGVLGYRFWNGVQGPRRGPPRKVSRRDENKLLRSSVAFGVLWIVDYFPQMSIRVAKVTGVDAPGSVVQFSDWCSGRFGFR